MTEHRPPCFAFSLTAQDDQRDALVQHDSDGAVFRDTILLLPLLLSSLSPDLPPVCMYITSFEDKLHFCNKPTQYQCPGCGCPTCERHQSSGYQITVRASRCAGPTKRKAALCETCASLPLSLVSELYVFRNAVNEVEVQR